MGDRGGDLGFTFRYLEGGSRGEGAEGRFNGTMNRPWSLSPSTGAMSGADSLVMELSLTVIAMVQRAIKRRMGGGSLVGSVQDAKETKMHRCKKQSIMSCWGPICL